MTAPAMVAEFDDVAGWTADAVEHLGERYAVPATWRGGASPAALAWPAEARELSDGTRAAGASLGLSVVVARSPQILPAPRGNHLPTRRELRAPVHL
ncbi:hypothetical protein ACQPYK_23950 [Streptosporangium sp. CA-135522]|uniref:hypothetical protein n=1 Tax=Streptosporangium sp. CA-135522 TaxID=3240072 RepID=UPI003D915219